MLGWPAVSWRWLRVGAFVAAFAAAVMGAAMAGASASGRSTPPVAATVVGTGRQEGVVVQAGAVAGSALLGGSKATARRPATAVAQTAGVDPFDVEVVQTSADLVQHLTRLPDLEFQPGRPPAGKTTVIHVNDAVRYQRVGGLGAAMTDSSAWLLDNELPGAIGATVDAGLFGPSGIDLNSIRVPMGASDFTRTGQPYTYDDLPPGHSDPKLLHFSIAHDLYYIVPELRQALALNPATTMLATPWSPPAWMKNNDSLGNLNHKGTLRWSDASALARYFVKFIQAYAQAGVPIAAVSPQSEPTNATSYPGLELSEPAEARFVKSYLVPALRAAHLSTKIYGHDSGWSTVSAAYAKALVSDHALDKDLAGIAWHCYFGSPYLMSTVRRFDSSLDQIVDECSPGITPFPVSEAVIGSIRNWASTVELWNLALDPRGGPVQAPNNGCPGCTGLVTADEQTHTAKYMLAYYQLGQASAFVQRGAWHVDSEHYVLYDYQRPGTNLVTLGLDDVAFVNPDGSRVLLAYDNSPHPISFEVEWQGRYISYTLPSRATVTLAWDRA